MNKIDLLESIGLSKWESQTYIALLELGECKTGELCKKAEVPQSKIYSVLNSLIEKGLVSYITKGQIKFFSASDSKRVLTLFKEKESELQELFKKISTKKEEKSSVEMFEGLKSMRVFNASLWENVKKGEKWYGYSQGVDYPLEVLEFYTWSGARRVAVGLKDHLLISKKNKKEFEKTISTEDLKFVQEKTRYSEVIFPGDVGIFRDKILLYNWVEPYKLVVITDKNLAKQYLDFFMDLWEKAKKESLCHPQLL